MVPAMNDKSALLEQLRLNRSDSAGESRSALAWIAGCVCVLLLGALSWYFFGTARGALVRTAVAQQTGDGAASGASLLDASGYVVARREATVSSKITGKVLEVLIEEGQRVAASEVLARLDDSNARARLNQASAQIAQAQANLHAAQIAFEDARPIYQREEQERKQALISAQDFDSAKATYNAAETAFAVAQRSAEVARATLVVAQRDEDDTVVRAPFAGVVTVKAAQPGEMVSPISAGGGFTRTGIGTIVDMDSLEVEVDVNENFITRVHPGQSVTIRLNAYPDWAIPGEVIAIIPTADRSKATVKVRVGFRQKDPRILPEMGARVSFLENAGVAEARTPLRRAVVVPPEAVEVHGDAGTVFLLHGDRVEERAVKLGAQSAQGQVVLSGIEPGAKLAIPVSGVKLHDGDKVRLARS
jgi:RND family efflux transporter MFP subunit